MKVKALKFIKKLRISRKHGNGRFSQKKANFTQNVTAMKSWIRLVPMYRICDHSFTDTTTLSLHSTTSTHRSHLNRRLLVFPRLPSRITELDPTYNVHRFIFVSFSFKCSVRWRVVDQRIRGFTTMRYINRLFTYLLTYLLSWLPVSFWLHVKYTVLYRVLYSAAFPFCYSQKIPGLIPGSQPIFPARFL